MAAYTTLDNVRGLMAQFTISATTKPTETQAQVIVDETADEINAKLASAGVTTVPVTTPTYYTGWLGRVNAYGAAAAILKSMFPAAVGAGETPAWAFWEKRYQEALTKIGSGDGIPPEILSGARIRPSSYFTRYPTEEVDLSQSNSEPFFRRRKTF